jgi:TetR/AcrR family transcriptional regulator, transcriptional repressor for nem operon
MPCNAEAGSDEEAEMTKGERTKQEIVRNAAPIFNTKGYEGTSLSDLMTATGLQKGGIYRHFATKEELAAEAFDYAWGKAVSGRLDGVSDVSNSVDRIKKMIANFVERRSGLVEGGCPLLNTAIEADDGNALLRGRARKALRTWSERISALVKEGKAKQEIDARTDPRKLSQLIIGSLEGALMISRINANDGVLADAQTFLNEYLEEKVRTAKRNSSRKRVS